jgi:hypothetical protein
MPLEYGTFRFASIIHPLLWLILGSIGVRLLQERKNRNIVMKLTIAFGIYIMFTFIFLFRLGFCRSANDSILYVNKNNPETTIVCRDFECYQTTADCEYYLSQKIFGGLKWNIRIYDANVEATDWEKILK